MPQKAPWLFHNLPEVCGDHPWMVLPLAGDNTHLSLLIRSISQRPFRHVLPYHSSKQWSFPTTIFLSFDLFRQPSFLSTFWTTWFGTELLGDQPLPVFACNLNTLDLFMALDPQVRRLSAEFSHGVHVSTCLDKNNPGFFVQFKTFPWWYFPTSLLKKQFFFFLSHRRPACGWPQKFLWRRTTRSSMLFQLSGLCRGGILTQISGHSCFGNHDNLGALVILTCTLKLRHLFLQPYQEALRWCPGTWPLPSETRKHLALCTLLCILLRLWRCPSGAQLAPCISGGVLQGRRSSSDRGPSNSRCELFFHPSSPDWWLQTLISPSSHPVLEFSSIYPVLYQQRLWLLASSELLEKKLAYVLDDCESFPHTLLGDVVHSSSLHFSGTSCIFWIWLLLTSINWSRTRLRFPSTVFLHNARQSRSSILFQFQTSINNHLEVISVNTS